MSEQVLQRQSLLAFPIALVTQWSLHGLAFAPCVHLLVCQHQEYGCCPFDGLTIQSSQADIAGVGNGAGGAGAGPRQQQA